MTFFLQNAFDNSSASTRSFDSPVTQAGIKIGDVLHKVGNPVVQTADSMQLAIEKSAVGSHFLARFRQVVHGYSYKTARSDSIDCKSWEIGEAC